MPFTPATGSRLLVRPGPLSTVVFKALAQTLVTLTGTLRHFGVLSWSRIATNVVTHRYSTVCACREWGAACCCVVPQNTGCFFSMCDAWAGVLD